MKKNLCSFLLLCLCCQVSVHAFPGYKEKPMLFNENRGQITDQYRHSRTDIDFALQDPALNLFVGSGRLHYQFTRSNNPVASVPDSKSGKLLQPMKRTPSSYTVYRLDMELVGAHLNAIPVGNDESCVRHHYYVEQEGRTLNADVRSYQTVTYPDVYPGIDWVLYVKDGHVKYDFILHEGADPSVIRIRYEGATAAALQDDGSLKISTPLGTLSEETPVAWTREGRQPVACRFVQKGNDWGFVTDAYTGALVLDPGLKWSTYYGGNATIGVQGNAICTERSGNYNVYITGETDCPDRIATTGAHQTTLAGDFDIFLAKFTPDGALLWSTYYGGSNGDYSFSVSADNFGHVYIAGSTLSEGMATAGSYQTSLSGIAFNCYLASFDSTGQLGWSTYYGRAMGDYEKAYVASCKDGSVYFASTTQESSGISTPGAYKETVIDTWGVGSSYLVKFDSSGQRLWGTYYAGAGFPGGTGGYTLTEGGIAVDKNDNVFIAGSATDDTYFDFTGSHQPLHGGGSYDVFLGKFNASGQHQWGTYFGGSDEDRATSICTDPDDNVYLTALTLSTNNLATPGTSRATSSGTGEFIGDDILAKFSGDGQQLWGSYVGPVIGMFGIGDIATDDCSNVYVTGTSLFGAADIQPSPDAYRDSFHMGSGFFVTNAYLMRYAAHEGTLQYSTYYGEPDATNGTGVATDPRGNVYLLGVTTSDTGIATPDAYQAIQYGMDNMFLTKFLDVSVDALFTDTAVCVDGTFSLPYLASGDYSDGNIFSAELSDDNGDFSFTNPVIIGSVTAAGSGSVSCTIPPGATPGGTYRIRMLASAPAVTGSCWRNILVRLHGDPATISVDGFKLGTTSSYAAYQWYLNGVLIAGATDSIYTVTENGDYTVVVVEVNGCRDSSGVYTVTNVVGIKDLSVNPDQVRVYPNPACDLVFIQAPCIVNLTLTDIAGRILLQKKNSDRISVKLFPSGIYFLRITDENGSYLKTEKLVKNKE